MKVVETFEECRRHCEGVVGLVPTMGFLHEGHLSLIGASAGECDTTVVTIFVNPRQFGESSDLDAYPRDIDRDLALAHGAGADVVVVPTVGYMYPDGAVTTVDVPRVSDAMEGLHRPGHFRGVATVVAKLFAGVGPDRAYFGRKDAQQLAVVTTLGRDLSFPITVVGRPLVRESDGLALSSRNVRLAASDRPRALGLSAGLMAAADRFDDGCRSVGELTDTVADRVRAAGADLEYVALADAATAEPMGSLAGIQFLALAAHVGDVRLIDTITIDNPTGTVDRGTRLDRPSILYGGP